jgi:hypothetical protein
LKDRSYYQPRGISANSKPYAETFVRKVHRLLGQGYAILNPADFSSAEEEDITGELVRAIETVLDNTGVPRWTRWFSVHEEPRVHDAARRGKRRLRLDIRIDSSQDRPRARMCFEAKRLGSHHGVSVYLGSEGLQCFLDGRYARKDSYAGMLGYVQAGKPDEWAAKIEQAMNGDPAKYCLHKSGRWRRERLVAELSSTYRSGHDRPSVGYPIEILHTLLLLN